MAGVFATNLSDWSPLATAIIFTRDVCHSLTSGRSADCLIVQARNFVGELVVLLQFMRRATTDTRLTWCAATPILENEVLKLMIAELLAVAPGRGVSRVSLIFAAFRSLERGERIGAGTFLRSC